MTILVTGATGTVGRHLVDHLLGTGETVRALSRNPKKANLPEEVEVIRGDLDTAETLAPALDGVSGVHLITFGSYGLLENGEEIVDLMRQAGVERCTVLTDWEESSVQRALRAVDFPWTHLQPVAFMSNTLDWAEPIRTEGAVRVLETELEVGGAVVHESDIGTVAATALSSDGHAGQSYVLTGPEALSPQEMLSVLGETLGRQLELVPLTPDEAREYWYKQGHSEEMISFMLELGKNPPPVGSQVLPTIEEVTGRPARTFGQWAAEHVAAFRA